MRHVPMHAFKDNVARYIAQANDGEEIVVTRHGKAMARVIPAQLEDEERAKRLAVIEDIRAMRARMLAKNGPIATEEIVAWIREGREERDEQLWRSLS